MGTVVATATGEVIRRQLFNLEPTDTRSIAVAAAIVIAVIAVAVWVPASRAIRIQLAQVLRAA